MSIKTFEGFVNQIEDTKVVELQFSNSKDYYKAISVLYDNGFERPSFNPPTEGKITYKSDDHWHTMEFHPKHSDRVITLLKENGIQFSVNIKKPIEYKVLYHGGYYD